MPGCILRPEALGPSWGILSPQEHLDHSLPSGITVPVLQVHKLRVKDA